MEVGMKLRILPYNPEPWAEMEKDVIYLTADPVEDEDPLYDVEISGPNREKIAKFILAATKAYKGGK
jgi:hypothetical protein